MSTSKISDMVTQCGGDRSDDESDRTVATTAAPKSVMKSAEELTEVELCEYREIFNLIDRDGGGSISSEDLGELMDTLGICASQEEIDLMIQEIDDDSNGEIDFSEFVSVMSRRVHALYTKEQVRNAFRFFENKDNPGCILPAKLMEILSEHCKDIMTVDQVRDLIRHLETDNNGFFHYHDYIMMMMSS